jgi:hypothetical protein
MKPKLIKFVACGDNHGDHGDAESIAALLAYCDEFKPDVKIHLGDCFDLRALRQGIGSGDAESGESLADDLAQGIDFLRAYKPDVYLWGNHEHRLDRLITSSSSALIRDYCQDIKDRINREARQAGAKKILPYHYSRGVFRLGPIALVHGYAHGTRAVEQQGQHYAQAGGALVCGHIHRLESVALQRDKGGQAFSAGCLCDKEPGYATARLGTSRWGSGWVAGWVQGNDWKIWLCHKVGDRWFFQTDFKLWQPKRK